MKKKYIKPKSRAVEFIGRLMQNTISTPSGDDISDHNTMTGNDVVTQGSRQGDWTLDF